MRKAKYTDEDIIGAGKALIEKEKDVTPNAIKLHLGGGNPARIKKVWDDYSAESGSEDSGKSRLKGPLDPDDLFAISVDSHIRDAASQSERIFIKLLDTLKETTQERFEEMLHRQACEYEEKIGELKGQVSSKTSQVEYWKAERESLFSSLMKQEKENKALKTDVESLTRMINKLKNKQST